MVLDLHTFGFGCSLDATFVIPRGVFLSTISALELGLCGEVLCYAFQHNDRRLLSRDKLARRARRLDI